MAFPVLHAQAGTAADNLFELGHGTDHLIQHDQLGHLAVGSGGEELGGRGDDRVLCRDGDEIVQLALAVLIAAGDADHIIRILLHHVGVAVDERNAHALGRLFGGAEDDRLGHAVRGLQIGRDLGCHLVDAVLQDDVGIVIAVVVDAVRDRVAEIIQLIPARPPAVGDIGLNVDYLEGSEKAVLNPLLQAVGIHRIAEIRNVGNVLRLFGRGRHADLGSRGKILQDPAPTALLLGRTTVTLVYDDEVKEIRFEKLGKMLLIVVAHQLLIQGEIDLVGSNGAGVVPGNIDLVNDLLQRGEVLLDGLIHQDIAVGQVENLTLQAALQQAVDDLKGGIGLSGAGGHHQKQAGLPAGDGIQGAVDGDALVIAGRIGGLAAVIGLVQNLFLVRRDAGAAVETGFIAGNEFGLGGKRIHGKQPLGAGEKIVLHEAVTVGAVGKGQVQHPGIGHRLLQAERNTVVVILRLNNGNGIIRIQIEKIIRPLGRAARHEIAADDHTAIGDLGLHGDLPAVPFGSDRRRDVMELDIFL